MNRKSPIDKYVILNTCKAVWLPNFLWHHCLCKEACFDFFIETNMSKDNKMANALSFRQTKNRWAYEMGKYPPAHPAPTPLFCYRDSSSLLPTTSFFHEIMLRARKYKNKYTYYIWIFNLYLPHVYYCCFV